MKAGIKIKYDDYCAPKVFYGVTESDAGQGRWWINFTDGWKDKFHQHYLHKPSKIAILLYF